MVNENDCVAIFNSIHRVMKAEKVLKLQGARVQLIPVPRQLTSDCGLAIRCAGEDRLRVTELLAAEKLANAQWFSFEHGAYKEV